MTFYIDSTLSGWKYIPAGTNEVWTLIDGVFYYTGASLDGGNTYDGSAYVVLTGRYTTARNGDRMYETTGGGWICITDGWEKKELVQVVPVTTAQAIVNRIIAADRKIIANNLLCARFADKFNSEQKKTLYDLQNRLQERQTALQNDGLIKDIKKAYPEGYAELEPYLQSFMASGGVGVATWVIVVVAAVVIASLSTAAYFAYKAFAAEAEQDVKYSQELTKVLETKLTAEEYQQLLDETKGIVTKARISQSVSSYGKIIGILAAAVGGYILLTNFKKGKQNEAK